MYIQQYVTIMRQKAVTAQSVGTCTKVQEHTGTQMYIKKYISPMIIQLQYLMLPFSDQMPDVLFPREVLRQKTYTWDRSNENQSPANMQISTQFKEKLT